LRVTENFDIQDGKGVIMWAGKVWCTLQLVFFALFPGRAGEREIEPEGASRCTPQKTRAGMQRLLNSQGDLQYFFPDCLSIAAPAVLFRLKREGFSRCTVQASQDGLLVQGRR